jgi:hypothetical protein
MPFDDEYLTEQQQPKKQIGLKNNNKASIFDKAQKKPSQKDFNNAVENIEEQLLLDKQAVQKSSSELKKLFDDKTLPENKNALSKSVENEIISNFISVISKINSSEHYNEGEGSSIALAFLIKILLQLKDDNNELKYKLSTIK